ncbi:MAG: Asp-tRNA(Asn)/Glu-tRNA(Gln) amidotransferase subunit GatC, partial [Patescibacteria group bacterium]
MLKKETVEKIADLAHLKISEEKKEKMQKDLSEVLDYVEKLEEVDTSDVDFKAISPIKNRVRKDKVEDTDQATKEKMRSMGKNRDDYFQVESI